MSRNSCKLMTQTRSPSCVGEEMTVLDLQTTTNLGAFVNRYGDTRAKQELLLFWALHTHARFNRLAILCATECSKSEIERALGNMVQNGLVDVQCHNGSPVYSLTSDEDVQGMLALLSTLDWRQRRLLFDHTRLANNPGGPTTRQEAV